MDQSESTAANLDRRSRRRWFQYSLRSFLILMTAFAVWLGIVVNRARDQREAVKAIKALGGDVFYDWQLYDREFYATTGRLFDHDAKPREPAWLRRILGDDFFWKGKHVWFVTSPPASDAEILQLLPTLKRLHALDALHIPDTTSFTTRSELRAALPNCEVRIVFTGRIPK